MGNWYVIQVWSGMQKPDRYSNIPKIELEMEKAGIECFNPTEIKTFIHHRTKKPIHKRYAMIPGYAFVTGHFNWPDLLGMDGVIDVIGNNGKPYVLTETAIHQLMLAEAFSFDEFVKSDLKSRGERLDKVSRKRLARIFPKGSLVRIHSDLWGTNGTAPVLEATGRNTIKVLMNILGNMTPVEIGVENLEKVS